MTNSLTSFRLLLIFSGFVLASFAPEQVVAQQGSATKTQGSASKAQGSASKETASSGAEEGWTSLFDGHSLAGWKANENPESSRVEDGAIIVGGERSHIFYVGDGEAPEFKNFELKLEVLTKPGANSGIYFHTKYQNDGWPDAGYESQVNNSQSDWRRTGSLYAVDDVRESPATDNEWFDYHIVVNGKQITITVNGVTTVDYTEPENPEHLKEFPQRKLSSGTFALQAHDPGSIVHFRNIRVKRLP